MLPLVEVIATELSIKPEQVQNTLDLWQQGATIPFIARYRKEKTGNLDETQLRNLIDRYQYLTELSDRQRVIIESIRSQNRLTAHLEAQINNCWQKSTLEDLYLPYKPKRRTKATIAREKGLTELAEQIKTQKIKDLTTLAQNYCYSHKLDLTATEALQGVADLIAEEISEKSQLRSYLRDYLSEKAQLSTTIKPEYPEGSTKYEMYRQFQISIRKVSPHQVLAIFRGENEGILTLQLEYDKDVIITELCSREIKTKEKELREFYQKIIVDSFKRLIEPSIVREIRAELKNWADLASIETFASNLRELLLAPPAGMKPTLAIDPGLRTGCKVVVLSETGKLSAYEVIYPHLGEAKRQQASQKIKEIFNKYNIELVAIGNGTASRETEKFITETISDLPTKPQIVIVNESGASVYSASDLARAEFPDLDVTIRGAISIGRRLQDPLAELVKIEPKSIGVGQYQHDVDQKLLKKKLAETVESCVNYVGVDLNTASAELLSYVSGITPTLANNIVKYRDSNGPFVNRQQLLKVPKLGNKAFEQAAGFLRIRDGENPLDNTAVHPESYPIATRILNSLNIPLLEMSQYSTKLPQIDIKELVTKDVGLPTLEDILQELAKPGRDPRSQFQRVNFKSGVEKLEDLVRGMELEGIVTNVVNFGAFVDIGVHQDGLVHISQLANHFVRDIHEVVKVGQIVRVRVLEVNLDLRRISLTMKCD